MSNFYLEQHSESHDRSHDISICNCIININPVKIERNFLLLNNCMYNNVMLRYHGYTGVTLVLSSLTVSRVVPPDTLPSPPVQCSSSPSVVTPVNTPPGSSSKVFPKFIQKLLEMGFSSVSAEQAVEVVGEDLDKAVHLLTQGEIADKAHTPTKETCPPV